LHISAKILFGLATAENP